MIYQGFGWGVGSSLGRAATASLLGSSGGSGYAMESVPSSEAPQQPNPCAQAAKAFGECISNSPDDLAKCQPYADLLTSCKRNELSR